MSFLVHFLIFIKLIGVLCVVHGIPLYMQQPVLTIKTERGQVFDCVNFYTQPAFSNALLKKHISEVNITSLQGEAEQSDKLGFGLKDGCPLGTVPILRLPGILIEQKKYCVAFVQAIGYRHRTFLGAGAATSLYKPKVYGNQFSKAQIGLSNGEDIVQAGWMVNPTLYKDSEAHLYAQFNAGPTECLNFQCPGFVQVSRTLPLGIIADEYNHVGDTQTYFWSIYIDKREVDGNWWLSMGPNKAEIGYWPKSLFSGLAKVAKQVSWGGAVSNPDLIEPYPFMGSGIKGRNDSTLSAMFFQLSVDHGLLLPEDTKVYENCKDYSVYDAGKIRDFYERRFYYGGPFK